MLSSAQANRKTLLIIGDSLSAGYGIEEKRGWVSLLKQRLSEQGYDYRVVNDSISGDTTSNGLSRIKAGLKRHKPNLVLIELGGNDGLRGISPKTMSENLSRMIVLAKSTNAKVILLAVPLPPNYGPAYINRFLSVYRKLAAQENIPLVNNFLKGIGGHPDLMQADGIHPNVKAQPLLLNNAWPIIRPQLELNPKHQ